MSINIKKQLSQYAIDKHIKPMLERDKQAKRQKLKSWFYNNWISIAGLIISILALVVAIISIVVSVDLLPKQ